MQKFIQCAFLFVLLFGKTYARPATQQEAEEIKANAKAYAEAFNKKDVKSLTSFWKENATYTRPDAKDTLEGRKLIVEKMTESFANSGNPKLSIDVKRVIVPEEGKAIEIGTTLYTDNSGETTRTTYKSSLTKENGKWLIQNVREMINKAPPSHYAELKPLEWLVGEWSDSDEDMDINVIFAWDKTKNFLKQKIAMTVYGEDLLDIEQVIGWDPIQKKIRSWVFDSDGGFGESAWTQNNNSWIVQASFTLPNGTKGSATNIYKKIDANTFNWSSINREVNGEKLPDIKETKISRTKGN